MFRTISFFLTAGALLLPGCSPTSDEAVFPSLVSIDGIPKTLTFASGPADPGSDTIAGQYVIHLAPVVADQPSGLAEVLDSLGAAEFSPLGLHGGTPAGLADTYTFATDRGQEDVLRALFALDTVAWVEPLTVFRATSLPDDPYASLQWNLTAIGVTDLWDTVDGSDVVVAVVDTGVSPGVDGVHELLSGYDFIDEDEDPSDPNGHGTHVAGTVAQTTDNGIGVAGVAPGAAILPVRVLDEDGIGTSVGLAAGIIWAVAQGADIVNLSLSSNAPSTVVEEACTHAEESGVLVIAASGNDGFSNFVSYPAAYDTTIAVGATDLANERAYYSNQGPELDLVAPGGDLTADRNGDFAPDGILQETVFSGQWGYLMMAGTSMATPHVSGVAALLIAGGITGPGDLRTALVTTAEDLGDPGEDDAYGFGLVDPQQALGFSPPAEPPPFEIIALGSRPLGPGRALLRWRTHQPSTTYIEGETGWVFEDVTDRHRHRALARGEPGHTVLYQVSSISPEGYEATSEIEVTFF